MFTDHTVRRYALSGIGIVLAATITACGTSAAPQLPPVQPGPLPGPTLRAQTFGAMCPQIASGAKAGGIEALSTKPISEAALDSPFTQHFATALEAAHIRQEIDGMSALTVFAPYDSAFDRFEQDMGHQRYQALLGDPAALATLLRAHIVDLRLDRAGLLAAGTVHTLSGGDLRIVDEGQTIKIVDSAGDSAHVLCGNVQTGNANLYLIDHVLAGPAPGATAGPA